MAESEPQTERRKKRAKKKKTIDVRMEVLSESTDRIAPMVGYFPSGFDPAAAGVEPSVKVYRNQRRNNRLELVVTPRNSNVAFVGKSYSGEAAAPQLCTYALGVLDKETQTLKIVPIAANKIFRLEPQILVNQPAHTEPSEGLTEESLATVKVEKKIADLTSLYGTKKDRDKDTRWRSLNQQRNDPSAYEHEESQMSDANIDKDTEDDVKETTAWNIPPYDPSADAPERVYLLDEIIPKGERIYLMDILEDWHSGEDISLKPYPSFVSNRIHKLGGIQDEEEKEKLACMLSYITHLLAFWERSSFSRHSKSVKHSKSSYHSKIPRMVYQKLLRMFMDSESHVLSTQKNELLIGYILVLTLFVDNFKSEPSDIARDLKMTFQSLKPYYQQLGCKISQKSPQQLPVITLPVPLKFPDLKKRRRR
ncbi:DNA-directed RNA polymerase I subunit rpa49 [Typha latifolia]|uniref:DNA-directed RNA polymerase I subunit rpa49 n=1 Tax=Typha latifolia TaxID=4733 RepID=UPI003C2B5D8B